MTIDERVHRVSQLDVATRAAVLVLLQAADDSDGTYPLSEHVVLHLRHGGDTPAAHLLAVNSPGGPLIGYAHVDPTDPVEGASAELVVHPMYRRRGLGRALVEAAIAVADERSTQPGRLRLWAHGDHPSATALALTLGFERSRTLLQMRRSLSVPLPEVALPPDIRLRAFRPGEDDRAWLELNAEAFADLPDQGGWTLADLKARLSEPWFDPAGFLIAERVADGDLIGFHWTKIHGATTHEAGTCETTAHAHDPIGEVYVLGISPKASGKGLGTALTVAGLGHLRSRGLDQVMLYVDEANPRAVAMYSKLGFARWSTDICFRRQM